MSACGFQCEYLYVSVWVCMCMTVVRAWGSQCQIPWSWNYRYLVVLGFKFVFVLLMAEPSFQPQPFYSSWAQRDSWALKSTGCSSRGSGFHFQHAYGAWQPYVTSFLRDLLLSFGFCGHQTCMGYIGIHKGKFFFFLVSSTQCVWSACF